MKTNVEIIAESSEAGLRFSPPGVEIHYSYNQIPYCAVDLTPEHLKMLCNFEQFRRKAITITVKSTNGCIRFDGLIDGLSVNQTVGTISYRLIVKHKFQTLMETYPKLPGLHPASVGIFTRQEVLKVRPDSNSYLDELKMGQILKPPADANIIEFIVHCIKMFVANQEHIELFSQGHPDAHNIVKIANQLAQRTLAIARQVLERIDTQYVANTQIRATDYITSDLILQQLTESNDNLFTTLTNILSELGCAVVIGNDKIYIVPEVGFLKQPHVLPVPSTPSKIANIVYPSQYDSFSFDDNGYRDIKACYVISDENVTYLNAELYAELGGYIDPDPNVTGGVLVLPLPKAVALGASGMYFNQMADAQKAQHAGVDNLKDVMSADEIAEEHRKIDAAFDTKAKDIQKRFINNWAQLKYLQSKFVDRVGAFTTFFNPNFAPAACGTLYTKHPGTYIDFFVTRVTHRFQIGPPNYGEAKTIVNFNCGRIGTSAIGQGMDVVSIYGYTPVTGAAYAADFVNDVTSL